MHLTRCRHSGGATEHGLRPPAEHFTLGQKLRGLRERSVLVVGSGNVAHNLRAMRRGTGINAAYDWAGFQAASISMRSMLWGG